MALGVGVPIPTIATAGVRIVPDLTGFAGLVRAGGLNQATLGAGAARVAIGAAAGAAVAFGAASVAAATRASDAFVDFEDSLIKIQTLTGTAAETTEEWGQRVLELAPEVGRGPQELADALFFVASAGLEGESAFQALEASARGAALGLGSTEEVADAVTSAIGAYGEANLSAAEATDVLAATVDRGKVEADALAGSIGRVVPIAAAAGVEFNEVGAAVAALSRTGLDADEATTALRQLLNNLINPSRESADALASVGLSAQEIRDSLDKSLLDTLLLLRERFDGNTEGLFNLIPNIRALTGFLSLAGENAEQTAGIFDDLANSTGFVDERFGILAESNAFRRDQAIAAIQSAFIGEGEASAEAITGLLETVADIVPEILPDVIEVGEEILGWAQGAADFAAGLVDIKNQLDQPLSADDSLGVLLLRLLGLAGNAISFAGSADLVPNIDLSDNERELRNNIDLLDEYVNRFGQDRVFTQKNFGPEAQRLAQSGLGRDINFQEGQESLAQRLAQAQDDLFDTVGNLGPQIIDDQFFDESIEGFRRLRDEVVPTAGAIEVAVLNTAALRGPQRQVVDSWGVLQTSIATAVEEVGNYGSAVLALSDPVLGAITAVENAEAAFDEAFDDGVITDEEAQRLVRPFLEANAAIEGLDPAQVTNFQEIVTPILEGLGSDFESVFGDEGVASVAIGNFGEILAQPFGEDGEVLSNLDGWGERTFGPAVGDELAAGITAGTDGLDTDFSDAVVGNLTGALASVKSRLGIRSPSSVWAAEVGRPIAQGIAQGFRDGIPDIIAAFGEVPDPPTGPFGGGRGDNTTVNVYNPTEESIGSGVQRGVAVTNVLVRNN